MDISSTRQVGHRRLVCGSVEDDLRNLFASSFIWKDENNLPRRRISKYNTGQEIRTGTPEFSDVSSGELLKFHMKEPRTDTGHDGRGGFSNADHLQTLSEERREGKKSWDVAYK